MSKAMDKFIRDHIAAREKKSADDARVKSAAYDLLAALTDYMSQFGQALDAHGIECTASQHEADAKARAAIAKATGK